MTKIAPAASKKNSLKPKTARKRVSPPFANKMPFIRSLILESVEPGIIKKIYLFGSYAYGRPTKDSDIDLCVIIKNNLDKSNVYQKIALSLREEFFYDIQNPKGLKNTILTKGKILYE